MFNSPRTSCAFRKLLGVSKYERVAGAQRLLPLPGIETACLLLQTVATGSGLANTWGGCSDR